MKKIIILPILIILTFISCGKMPINGDLDGMWQLTQIDKTGEASENVKEKCIYYSIQLHLISLKRVNGIEYLGRFNHTGDSLHIEMINEKEEPTPDAMAEFGMDDIIQHFGVEKLNSKKMILKSNYARLYFRKF